MQLKQEVVTYGINIKGLFARRRRIIFYSMIHSRVVFREIPQNLFCKVIIKKLPVVSFCKVCGHPVMLFHILGRHFACSAIIFVYFTIFSTGYICYNFRLLVGGLTKKNQGYKHKGQSQGTVCSPQAEIFFKK